MKRQVIYLLSGTPHVPYLAVSLYTLRQHWGGSVRVFAWPESIGLARRIAEDGRLNIRAEESKPAYRARRDERRQGKNDQFIAKLRLFPTLTDIDLGLYLDADTSIHGDLMPLFREAKHYGFCATRFGDWVSTGGVIQARVGRLREFPQIDQQCVEEVFRHVWPSVNGGVWAARPGSPVLKTWEEWTWEARSVFIADEACLHALMPKHVPSREMTVWTDGRFNCPCNSRWRPEKLNEQDVVVWHYHGDSNVRPDKHGGQAHRRWWPLWRQCLAENIGGCREWQPRRENGWLGNKWFKLLEQKG